MMSTLFNIDLAKQGAAVCTREGHAVRLICFDHCYRGFPNTIIGLLSGNNHEMLLRFNPNGTNVDHLKNFDLQMVEPYEYNGDETV